MNLKKLETYVFVEYQSGKLEYIQYEDPKDAEAFKNVILRFEEGCRSAWIEEL